MIKKQVFFPYAQTNQPKVYCFSYIFHNTNTFHEIETGYSLPYPCASDKIFTSATSFFIIFFICPPQTHQTQQTILQCVREGPLASLLYIDESAKCRNINCSVSSLSDSFAADRLLYFTLFDLREHSYLVILTSTLNPICISNFMKPFANPIRLF